MFYWHGRRSRKKGREGTGRMENYRQTSSSIYIDSCVQRLMGFRGRLRIMQGSRLTRADLSSVKPNVCSLWRAKRGPSSSQLDPFRSREDQFGCQTSACHLGVFTDARIIHSTLLETLTNPAIASRQRQQQSATKRLDSGANTEGEREKSRGLTGAVLLLDERRDDVENQLYACPLEKGYFLFTTPGVLSPETWE